MYLAAIIIKWNTIAIFGREFIEELIEFNVLTFTKMYIRYFARVTESVNMK